MPLTRGRGPLGMIQLMALRVTIKKWQKQSRCQDQRRRRWWLGWSLRGRSRMYGWFEASQGAYEEAIVTFTSSFDANIAYRNEFVHIFEDTFRASSTKAMTHLQATTETHGWVADRSNKPFNCMLAMPPFHNKGPKVIIVNFQRPHSSSPPSCIRMQPSNDTLQCSSISMTLMQMTSTKHMTMRSTMEEFCSLRLE